MLAHFDDSCLWVYVLVDDMCKELEGHLSRPLRTYGHVQRCCRA